MTGAYRMLLPDGWRRVRLAADPDGEADRFVERVMALRKLGDGSDAVIARRRMRDEVRGAFGRAMDAGAIDLYLFEGSIEGVQLPMSFIVSVLYLGPIAADLPIGELGVRLAGDAETLVIDAPVGRVVRWIRRRVETAAEQQRRLTEALPPGPPVAGVSDAAHRELVEVRRFVDEHAQDTVIETTVDYLVPVPGESGAFVALSFDAPGPAYVEERVTHFDALMGGFGWAG